MTTLILKKIASALFYNKIDIAVYYTTENETHDQSKEMKSWLGEDYEYVKQKSNCNLGEKIKSAFEDSFKLGYQKVIIISSDVPSIEPKEHIIAGFNELSNFNSVIGPSESKFINSSKTEDTI
jgi:uncharacterized protein